MASLHNYCAMGPDGVPNELVKYACQNDKAAKWVAWVAEFCNQGNLHLAALGDGLLIPIQKSGMPQGREGNLQSIVLLNGIQKVLSLTSCLQSVPSVHLPNSQT